MSKSSQSLGYIDCDEYSKKYLKDVERRIVLIGKTGTGKSTFGNAISGKETFDNKGSRMKSKTTICKMGRREEKEGKAILVVDTPGLSDTKRPKEEILNELYRCTTITSPGPHVFCLLIRCDERFTPECVATLNEFCSFFGEEIFKHLIVVFTHVSELGVDETIHDCIRELPDDFQEKFSRYGGKVIGVESKHIDELGREKQIKGFFTLMEEIITRNHGDYYSDNMFKAVEKAFKEGERKCLEKANQKLEAIKESLTSDHKKREQELLDKTNELMEQISTLTHDMKLSEQDKEEKITSLNKKLEKVTEERVNDNKEHANRVSDMQEKQSQIICNQMIEARNIARKEVESKSFSALSVDLITKGAECVYEKVTGGITTVLQSIWPWN